MTDTTEIVINGTPVEVPEGVTVAAALLNEGIMTFRRDLHERPRGPLCGMGSCMECRVTIDGATERRSCLILVRHGMQIETSP